MTRPSANKAWLRALERTREVRRGSPRTLPVVVEEMALDQGGRPALIGDDGAVSYAGLAERLRRYARWAIGQGLAEGGTVALLMPNRPEYLAAWLGVTRVGGIVALLNTNLRGEALTHSLRAAAATHVLIDATLAEVLDAALEGAPDRPEIWIYGADRPGASRIETAVEALDGGPLDAASPAPVLADRALLIYTSGTTGLPKAAHVSHHRVMMWSGWFAGMMDATPHDRLYDCLPLYHSVGGVVATGAMLASGGAVVIRERFSASRFWTEVAAFECTIFQYIGELCRYLLAAPPQPGEQAHRLRLACGNGLRGDVWPAFQARFAILQVLEFYAATEGAFSLYNAEGEPGAIGRVPPFLAHRFPAAIVRFDPDTEQPLRDGAGRCVACGTGEVGEAIGRIAAPDADAANRFEGYTDAAATAKKVLRGVFEPGDAWLRTGDLMRKDGRGFWYFVDRVGDTFRWKGENVASTEVAEAICGCAGVVAACVYGVAAPGADGRAGMAAIQVDGDFHLSALQERLAAALPAYARPMFLRITPELTATETFKLKKQDLIQTGFDPAQVADPLYFHDSGRGYIPLDADLFARIAAGDVRL